MPATGVRLFLAAPLAPPLLATLQVLQDCLREKLPRVRWSNPETLHLTLRFLGELPEETLEPIGRVMLSVSALHAPFSLPLSHLGAFPSVGRPRVLWAGFSDVAPLLHLHHDLTRGLEQIGLPPEERRFHPHLTLGRGRAPLPPCGELLSACRSGLQGGLTVERLILYESRLLPSGALHLPRRDVPLAGGGPAHPNNTST